MKTLLLFVPLQWKLTKQEQPAAIKDSYAGRAVNECALEDNLPLEGSMVFQLREKELKRECKLS